jgi:hypothetical protein
MEMMVHDELRGARRAKGISLVQLEKRAGVRVPVLAAIERGAYDELPSGLYGRHAVRAYARAVGLDADRVLEEVGRLLPSPEDPLDGLARVRGFARRPRGREGRQEAAQDSVSSRPAPDCASAAFQWRAAAASAIDGAVLTAPVLLLAKGTALAAGTGVSDVIASALPAWALIAALVSLVYFVLLGGVRNATFGTVIAGVRAEPCAAARFDAVVRRGLECALRESSILVDWLVASGHSQGWLRALTHRG